MRHILDTPAARCAGMRRTRPGALRSGLLVMIALAMIGAGLAPGTVSAASGVSQSTFTLDNVTITVRTPFLPAPAFETTPPGDYRNQAAATAPRPYRDFTVIAAPFGFTPSGEAVPVAQPGGATAHLAAMAKFRTDQGEAVQTGASGPTASIFGRSVRGQVSLVRVPVAADAPVPVVIVEWVVEAGPRLWIVRASQEEPAGTSDLGPAAGFIDSLNSLVLTSSTLANPTMLVHDPGQPAQPGMPRTGGASIGGTLSAATALGVVLVAALLAILAGLALRARGLRTGRL